MKKLAVALTLVGAVMTGATAHAQEDSYNNGNSRTPTVQPPTTTAGASFTVNVG